LGQVGCNVSPDQDSGDLLEKSVMFPSVNQELNGPRDVQRLLFEMQDRFQAERTYRRAALLNGKASDSPEDRRARDAMVARMRGFLESGDRILMGEAIAWAKQNPGLLYPIPKPP